MRGTRRIVDVATPPIILSVFAHGLTAPWRTERYVRWLQASAIGLTLRSTSRSVPSRGNHDPRSVSSWHCAMTMTGRR
jgi:hypothetical protein